MILLTSLTGLLLGILLPILFVEIRISKIKSQHTKDLIEISKNHTEKLKEFGNELDKMLD